MRSNSGPQARAAPGEVNRPLPQRLELFQPFKTFKQFKPFKDRQGPLGTLLEVREERLEALSLRNRQDDSLSI